MAAGGGAVSIDLGGTRGGDEYRCFMTWQDFSRRRNFARERESKERLTEINTPPAPHSSLRRGKLMRMTGCLLSS